MAAIPTATGSTTIPSNNTQPLSRYLAGQGDTHAKKAKLLFDIALLAESAKASHGTFSRARYLKTYNTGNLFWEESASGKYAPGLFDPEADILTRVLAFYKTADQHIKEKSWDALAEVPGAISAGLAAPLGPFLQDIVPSFMYGADRATWGQEFVHRMIESQNVHLDKALNDLYEHCLTDRACNEAASLTIFKDYPIVGVGGLAASTPAEVVAKQPDVYPDFVVDAAQPDGSLRMPLELAPIKVRLVEEGFVLIGEQTSATLGVAAELGAWADQQQADMARWLAAPPDVEAEARERARRLEAKAQEYLGAAQGVLAGVTGIVSVFDAKAAADISRVGTTAMQVADAAVKAVDAITLLGKAASITTSLGAAAATGNLVGAAFTLIGLFTNAEQEPGAHLMAGISAIRDDIGALQRDMGSRLDRIDRALELIYVTIVERLDQIDIQNRRIVGDLGEIKTALLDQALTLRRLEDRLTRALRTESRRELRAALDDGLDWRRRHTGPMPWEDFKRITNTLHNYAFVEAFVESELDEGARPTEDHELSHQLRSVPLHDNLRYIDHYLRRRGFPLLPAGDRSLANPFTWSLAANAYVELLFEWPDHGRRLTRENTQDMMDGGRRLIAAFAEIPKRPGMFEQLYKNYEAKATVLADALEPDAEMALTKVLVDDLGHRAEDPRPDLWASSQQPLDFRPPGVATVEMESAERIAPPPFAAEMVPHVLLVRERLRPAAHAELRFRGTWELLDLVKRPRQGTVSGRVSATITLLLANNAIRRRRAVSRSRVTLDMGEEFVDNALGVLRDADAIEVTDLPLGEDRATRPPAGVEAQWGVDVGQLLKTRRRELGATLADLAARRELEQARDSLSGAKDLIEHVLALGFARAERADATLRASLHGAPIAKGGIALCDGDGYIESLRELASWPQGPGAGRPTDDWALHPTRHPVSQLSGTVARMSGRVADGDWHETDPTVEAALRRLELVDLVLHLPKRTGDIVSELPTLKQGSQGDAVRRLHGLLRAALPTTTDSTLPLTSTFSSKTKAWVIKAQRKYKLPATGIVDADTWRRLLGLKPTK